MKDLPWWKRRLITVPGVILAWALVVAIAPVGLLVAVIVDVVRRVRSGTTPVALRMSIFLVVYLTIEVITVAACLVFWLATGFGRSRSRLVDLGYGLQRWWANRLWDMACAIFRVRLEVEGEDAAAPGPLLALVRHASIVDTLLPLQLFTRGHGFRLRYVLKRELLVDPALDIAGNWIRNHFIDRGGTDTEAELNSLRQLATDVRENEAVVIFPEGTRFTPNKLQRSLAILAKRSPRLHNLASDLRSVLPPRPTGVLALLDAAPLDVVVVAHHGLDGFAEVADIWNGRIVGTLLKVKLWRIPFDEIPAGRSERTEWLFRTWRQVDDWIRSLNAPAVADG